MFKYLTTQVHKSKKGFTLIELLVSLVILSIVTGMIFQLSANIYKNYKMVEDRWEMQNEVHYIMKMFEGNKEALTTSSRADIFYDPEHKTVPSDGYMDPSDLNYQYSYFFTEAIDPENLSAGYNLFYKQRGGEDTVQLNDPGIPINIEFSIPVQPSPLKVDEDGTNVSKDSDKENDQGYVTEAVPADQKRYQKSTFTVKVISSGTYSGKYSLSTSFTLNNMLENQQINYYMGTPTDTTGYNGVTLAGWTDTVVNAAYRNSGYPVTFTSSGGDVKNEERPGNVVRFISAESFIQSSKADLADVSMCSMSKALIGSKLEVPVKGALRDLRDNVLAKTTVGQTIITKYYTEWSPALIKSFENHPQLTKAVCRVIAYPAAIVSFFIAS